MVAKSVIRTSEDTNKDIQVGDLMITQEGCTVVLVTDTHGEGWDFSGTVVNTVDGYYNVGLSDTDWIKGVFKPFKGTVELSQ